MRFYLIALLIFIPFLAHGWEPYQADVTQQAFPSDSNGIDHLLPSSGKVSRGYYLIRYDVSPAMAFTETHLIIYRKEKTDAYILETRDTWKDPDKAHPSGVTLAPDTKIVVTKALADLALQMWVNALLEVRYDRRSSLGFDGETYTFTTWVRGNDWLCGTAWSPDKELPPKWMVQAGDELIKLGRTPTLKIEDGVKDLQQLHDKLFAYLKEHGRN